MTKFQEWMLGRIFRQEVRQGYDHDARIRTLYAKIRNAARKEFCEDNAPTLDSFLREQFELTQWDPKVEEVKEKGPRRSPGGWCQCARCSDPDNGRGGY